ncbi:MAG TPA: hypothetical protein VFI60_06755 [Candidatus Acidoferrum sp.]|nr:hypothetical protein [Candidatus Acidoferrum sp.]
MVQWRTIFFLSAISLALAVIGCPASRSFFSLSHSTSSAAYASGKSSTASSATKREKPAVAKHVWSDSAFSVYHNPDYGISFRYPRNFALQEQSQPSDSDSGAATSAAPSDSTASDVTAPSASPTGATVSEAAQAQEQQNVAQPSAHLIATVSIPSDAYPNTTFQSGTLQFLVRRAATAESCQPFSARRESGGDGPSGMVSIKGIPFTWREQSSSDADTRYVRREYVGYSAGVCYQFRGEVGVTAQANQEEGTTPAATKKILRTLEKIVLSLQVEPPFASDPTKAAAP